MLCRVHDLLSLQKDELALWRLVELKGGEGRLMNELVLLVQRSNAWKWRQNDPKQRHQ